MLDIARLKSLREGRGLSQTEAAKLAGMSAQQWNNIEGGRVGDRSGVSLKTLDKLARALKVSAKDLLK